MTTNAKEKAQKRTKQLVELRKSRSEQVKVAQTILKEQQTVRKRILQAMRGEPKSIPQLAEATEIPAHDVLWYVASMKKYGVIVETGMDEDYEYYLYQLTKEATA